MKFLALLALSAICFGTFCLEVGAGPVINETKVRSPQSAEADSSIADAQKTKSSSKNETKTIELTAENNYLDIIFGAYLLNPYTISPLSTNSSGIKERTVDSSNDTAASAFVEVRFNNVWAFNMDRRVRYMKVFANGFDEYDGWSGVSWPLGNVEGFKGALATFDIEGGLGFYWQGTKEASASTIVGSGDFSAEVTIGIPILRGLYTTSEKYNVPIENQTIDFYKQTSSAQSVSMILSYAGTTEKNAFDVHHRVLMGLGYRGAFKALGNDSNLRREILFSLDGGAARIESVHFVDDTSRAIVLVNGDVPDFRTGWGWGIEGRVSYPLGNQSYISLGSRLYSGLHDTPNQWSAFIGVTWSLDKLRNLLPN